MIEPLGAETMVIASVDGDQNIVARLGPQLMAKPGDQVELIVDPTKIQAFDLENEKNIRFG